MPNPVKLIDILSAQTAKVNLTREHLECDACDGSGEEMIPHSETGHNNIPCRICLGSGYNQLGLILFNLLKPPPEGYGPVELKTALAEQLAQQNASNTQTVQTEQFKRSVPSLYRHPAAANRSTDNASQTNQRNRRKHPAHQRPL